MIGTALKWLLIGYGADGNNPQYDIYNVVGNNIYPNIIPQNVGLPAISYSVEKNNPDKVKEVRSPNNRVSVEINVMDKSYAVVNQLSTLIINQLHRYKNSYNSNSTDGIGYGTTDGANKYGRFAPASTGEVQYVGGLQIQYLAFIDSIESYDEKLEVYKNTLNFDMLYIDDLSTWGADILLKFTDLNLMATNLNPFDDPLYTQPITIDQGVNYLFTPSVLVSDNSNISSNTLDGIYENFYDPSGISNTNRPTIKKDTNNPPKYFSNNYLEFGSSKYLLSSKDTDRLNRKYKEFTFFSVLKMPGSKTGTDTRYTASALFKRSSTSSASGCIFYDSNIVGDMSTTGICSLQIGGIAFQDDGAGADEERGFSFFAALTSWPMFGILPDISFEDPLYFAVSFKRKAGDNTEIEGYSELILSSDFSVYGDKDDFVYWDDQAETGKTFKEYLFNFSTLHSDITSYDTNGAGTLDMNSPIDIYDFVMWPEALTFGSNKYNEIKRKIIDKHGMYKRITD
tara:strand:+ start:5743 stop:7275 length:1533 start_codon:yes stop_codon:yes gene_type:complete